MIQVSEIVEVINITVDEINESVNIIVTEVSTPINLEVSEMGAQGLQGVPGLTGGSLVKVSAESIPSHTPVAIVNNLAYKLDASNPLHQFAFVGFSENGTSIGQNCNIKQIGEVFLFGWGLIPNQHYLAGVNGTLIMNNISTTNFTKVIAYATDSNALQIIKDSITVNK